MRAFQFGRYLRRVVVLPLFLIPIQAWAQTCSGPLPVTVNIPAVSVPKSLAVGQSIPGGKASFAIALTCSFNFAPGARWWLKTNPSATMTLVPGYSDVYTMSGMTAGIGFRVRGNNGMVLSPIDYGGTSNSFDLSPATLDPNMLVGSFELVKTAETVATGNFSFSTYASVDAVSGQMAVPRQRAQFRSNTPLPRPLSLHVRLRRAILRYFCQQFGPRTLPRLERPQVFRHLQ
jgi:hypothetical protein